jgi:hypothetical protein
MTTELANDDEIAVEPTAHTETVRIAVPHIPDSAKTDEPPEGADGNHLLMNTPPDPQAEHTRWMDRIKLTFAVWVVTVSFVAVVTLSLFQFFWQKELAEAGSLESAIDWSKSIATIALGFALGRTINENKSE